MGCGIACGSLLRGGGGGGANGRQFVHYCVGGRSPGRECGALGRGESAQPALETGDGGSQGIDSRVAGRDTGSGLEGSR
jgi:hypothetical protein